MLAKSVKPADDKTLQELYAAPHGHMSVTARKLSTHVGQVVLDELGYLEVPVSVTNKNRTP